MPLTERLAQFAAELDAFEDPQERLNFVVERARKTPRLAAGERTDANRVRGCVSVAWLVGECREGRCDFRADADSPVVRGLLVLLCDLFGGAAPAEIAAWETDPLEALGLARHLSPTRRNGLASARARIRELARSAAQGPQPK